MLYDVTDYPNLSSKAKALVADDETFEAVVYEAELFLGLSAPALTGEDAEQLRVAVARQVNWMLEMDRDAMFVKSISSSHTAQGVTYRDNITGDPLAMRIVAQVLARNDARGTGGWHGVRSVRG